MTSGLVLGKFLPPTQGHRYLIDFARHYVDDLTVVAGTLASEPIAGHLRVAWLREMFPQVRVLHLEDENPQTPDEHPDFWGIWQRSLRRLVPRGPDYVFASEPYGAKLAEVLGAAFVPVDLARELVPVSATRVRERPFEMWPFLPECVRPYFVRKVCIIGPESTGKTTLARALATHYGTVWVHEYARGLIEATGGEVRRELFPMIVRGQAAAEVAMARQANRLLFCDSDAYTTALYHELFFGEPSPSILEAACAATYDLYLVTDCDTPYVVDGQRFHEEKREWFRDRCLAWVKERGAPLALLRGGWAEREAAARHAVDELLRV